MSSLTSLGESNLKMIFSISTKIYKAYKKKLLTV